MVAFCLMLPAQANPHLSQDQALAIAQQFQRSMTGSLKPLVTSSGAVPETALTKIDYHNADNASDTQNSQLPAMTLGVRPHGYWQIKLPNSFDAEVDDVTGRVASYGNYAALDLHGDQPASEAIPKPQALQIARDALKRAGAALDNLKIAYIDERQDDTPPTVDDHKWYVGWLRTYQGIPYEREGARACLNAETGDVLWLRVDAQYLDPQIAVENVTQAQALSIAQAQLAAVGLPLDKLPLETLGKTIVPFNRYWQSGDSMHHTRQTRVVWNCVFGLPEAGFEVWVDTETGNVVGGYRIAVLGRSGKNLQPKFGHQLQR